jgi:hypothetical protein
MLGLLAAAVSAPATAQEATKVISDSAQQAPSAGQVRAHPAGIVGFVEFIAREDTPGGHTYIRYGRYDSTGRRVGVKISGLYPKGGWAGKIMGGIFPVAATTTPIMDDLKLPITSMYRRQLSAAQFAKLEAAVRDAHANRAYWNVFLHNCHGFIGRYAEAIGLNTPTVTVMTADAYISTLKAMNSSATRQ